MGFESGFIVFILGVSAIGSDAVIVVVVVAVDPRPCMSIVISPHVPPT